MKQSRINQLIEESGLQGFDFANDDCEVNWIVALHDDKMLARRTVTTDDDSYFECIAVPYAPLEETESLYEEIIADFVETCFDVMAAGAGADIGLFRDYAGANDPDLAQLLSFFGRDYADFLADVFFWYSVYVETEALLEDCDDDGDQPSYYTEEERLAQKVIWHLADEELTIELSDGAYYWEFAKANGRIWFHRVEVEEDGDYVCMMPSFGSVDPNDECAFSALRDAVIADFGDEDLEYYEVDDGVFELLDFDLEDVLYS